MELLPTNSVSFQLVAWLASLPLSLRLVVAETITRVSVVLVKMPSRNMQFPALLLRVLLPMP